MTPPDPQSPTPEESKSPLAEQVGRLLQSEDIEWPDGEPYVPKHKPAPTPSLQAAAPTAQALAEELAGEIRHHFGKPRLFGPESDRLMAILTPVLAKLVGENERLKSLWTEMRVVLAQSRDANCLASYGAAQVDAVEAANKILNTMPKDMDSPLSTARAERDTEQRMRRTMEGAHGEVLSECVKLRAERDAAVKDRDEWREATRVQTEKLIAIQPVLQAARQEASELRGGGGR